MDVKVINKIRLILRFCTFGILKLENGELTKQLISFLTTDLMFFEEYLWLVFSFIDERAREIFPGFI